MEGRLVSIYNNTVTVYRFFNDLVANITTDPSNTLVCNQILPPYKSHRKPDKNTSKQKFGSLLTRMPRVSELWWML